jgi:hypothetical protein
MIPISEEHNIDSPFPREVTVRQSVCFVIKSMHFPQKYMSNMLNLFSVQQNINNTDTAIPGIKNVLYTLSILKV